MDILAPKSFLRPIKDHLVEEIGFNMNVILPATHDTASAVVSVPDPEYTIYISSGTWSLIGIENKEPIINDLALNYNFTNEGGMDYRYRFLKNIMGLWMIQEVKRNYNDQYSFAELTDLAHRENNLDAKVNVNEARIINTENMIKEIQKYCKEKSQSIPNNHKMIAK